MSSYYNSPPKKKIRQITDYRSTSEFGGHYIHRVRKNQTAKIVSLSAFVWITNEFQQVLETSFSPLKR